MWNNGDELRVDLDCEQRHMTIYLNGVKHRDTIQLPADSSFYPWANIYNPGGNVTIVKRGVLLS